MSESDFLAAEAATASQKITDHVGRLGTHLKDSADVAAWARKYPWPTLGVAAALGFLAGSAIFGRRSKDNTAEMFAEALAAKAAAASAPPQPSMFSGLISQVVGALIVALEGAIAGAFSSRMNAANPPDTSAQAAPADKTSDASDDSPSDDSAP